MSYAIVGTLLLLFICWRIWRQGGLVTALLAVCLGVVIATAGGPIRTIVGTVVEAASGLVSWLSTVLF